MYIFRMSRNRVIQHGTEKSNLGKIRWIGNYLLEELGIWKSVRHALESCGGYKIYRFLILRRGPPQRHFFRHGTHSFPSLNNLGHTETNQNLLHKVICKYLLVEVAN